MSLRQSPSSTCIRRAGPPKCKYEGRGLDTGLLPTEAASRDRMRKLRITSARRRTLQQQHFVSARETSLTGLIGLPCFTPSHFFVGSGEARQSSHSSPSPRLSCSLCPLGLAYPPQQLHAAQGQLQVAAPADLTQEPQPGALIRCEDFYPLHLAHRPKIALSAACDRLVMRGSLFSEAVRIALIQVVSFSVMGSPKISITAAAAVRPIACSKASRIR